MHKLDEIKRVMIEHRHGGEVTVSNSSGRLGTFPAGLVGFLADIGDEGVDLSPVAEETDNQRRDREAHLSWARSELIPSGFLEQRDSYVFIPTSQAKHATYSFSGYGPSILTSKYFHL